MYSLTVRVLLASLTALTIDVRAGAVGGDLVEPGCCGRYAAAQLADYLGYKQGMAYWSEVLPGDRAPHSLAEITDALDSVGLRTLVVEWADIEVADLSRPCILVLSPNEGSPTGHCIVCFGCDGATVWVSDFPGPPLKVPRSKFRGRWAGTVIYAGPPGDNGLDRLGRESWLNEHRLALAILAAATILGAGLVMSNRTRSKRSTP